MTDTLPQLDELFELAKTDPEHLESLRRRCVESLINSAPPALRRRLRGLQFQIDSRSRMHATPLGACIEISKMMHASLHELNEALTNFSSNREPAPKHFASATVLPFTRDCCAS